MPAKPTKDTTAVNLELPTDLVERVRDFAKRDLRSIKVEFIRALQLLLETYDEPDGPTKDTTAVNLELPTDLVERVRDFARRDLMSIKAEFIRALQLLLQTYDESEGTHRHAPEGAGRSAVDNSHETQVSLPPTKAGQTPAPGRKRSSRASR